MHSIKYQVLNGLVFKHTICIVLNISISEGSLIQYLDVNKTFIFILDTEVHVHASGVV